MSSIDHPWINKAIERAQKKVEARNFDIRKTLIKFDDVMNDQRQVIFSQRLKVLKDDNAVELINDFLEEQINELLIIKNKYEKTNNRNEYLTSLKSVIGNPVSDESLLEMTAISDKNFRSEIKEIFDKKGMTE